MIVQCRPELIQVCKMSNLIHCISRDHEMARGFGVRVADYARQEGLNLISPPDREEFSLYVGPKLKIVNLIIKERHDQVAEFGDFALALWSWGEWVEETFPGEVWNCPKLGCGLDRLEWDIVKSFISEIKTKFIVWGVF